MSPPPAPRLLIVACMTGLAALALMTWQLFDPRVVPVILAMSVGQVLGTASFAAYGYVVLAELRARLRPRGDAASSTESGPR